MKWIGYITLSALSWAFVPIFAKLSIARIDPLAITTARSVAVSCILLVYSIIAGTCSDTYFCNATTRDWLYLAGAAICSCMSWLLYFIALQYGPVSKINTTQRMSIIFVIILAVLILHEPLTIKIIAGISCIMLGIFLIGW